MPIIRTVFVCILSVSAHARAQTLPPAPAATLPRAADAPYTIELQQTRVRFESDGTGRRELTARVKLADERAVRRWGQLAFLYQPETEDLEVTQVEVRKPDGTIVKSAAGAIQDLAVRPFEHSPLFLDERQKQITVAALRPGDVLLFGIVWTTKHPVTPGHFWFEHSFNKSEIVLDERLEIDVPATRAITMKVQDDGPAEASGGRGTSEGDRRIYRWKTSNLAISDPDAKQVGKEGVPPADVRLSSFADWVEFARWFRGLVSMAPDAEIRAKAMELTSAAKDEAARIDAIYSYVAGQIRYVSLSFGLGRFAPHRPSDVLKNQYGDCKDKVVLLGSLLAAIGVEAVPVLLNNARSISDTLASPLEMNHMIAVVPRSGDPATWTWMDPTLEVAPVGMLAAATRGRRALFIGDTRRPSAVLPTPADPPFPSIVRIDVRGRVNDIGTLMARATFTFRGDDELVTRTLVRALPREALKDLVTEIASAHGLTGDFADVTASDPASTAKPFQIAFEMRAKGYMNWAAAASKMSTIPTIPFAFAKEEEREHLERIDLGSPKTVQLHTEIEVPAGYTLGAPLPVHASNAGLIYQSRYTVDGQRFIADRELVTRAREIPAARFGEYSALAAAVQADFAQQVMVTGSISGIPKIPADANAPELYSAAFDAYEAKRYDAAAALWKRNTEVDPKMGDAWISLGLSYRELERYEEATAAIRKQIELDPYNKRAYGDLGDVLKRAGKHTDAVTAYAKHLELNPLDGNATRTLGELYINLERYREAATTLEKAAKLVKPDAWLFADVGTAYLHLREPDRAQGAFARALELSSTVAMRTKIAWELAEAGLDLDRAISLASAVEKEIVDETRQLELSALQDRHLDLMERLAWTWDALGWIHFQRGHLDDAARYVQAAWLLGGEPDVAFHLGQIYEKQTRLAEALNMFLTAQATSQNPTPEMMKRVKQLSGGGDLPKMLDTAKRWAGSDRLIPITEKASAGTAEFLSIVGSDRFARELRFTSGSDALRTFEGPLRQVRYPVEFPAESAARLALGIRVACDPEQRCFASVNYPARLKLKK